MKKKIISVIVAVALIISSSAVSLIAYASTQKLILNTKMSSSINGEDDLVWYYYTPDASGTYSFLSYNTPASEGYLFIKEVNEETGAKEYKQLAYSCTDDDYEANDHNFRQFKLTYHLEAGVKYYFAAGWYLSETRTTGQFTVMLRCDIYDVEVNSMTAVFDGELSLYDDGVWQTDTDGNKYYYYNLSKIIANTTITIEYADGTVSTSTGGETIDGYYISFLHNQAYQHWYPSTFAEYTANTLTVSVLGQTADMEINIVNNPLYALQGTVVDFAGNPIKNARITRGGSTIATTDSNGEFYVACTPGLLTYMIMGENMVTRYVKILVSTVAGESDYRETPIVVANCDYTGDGIINAKDYAKMKQTLTDEEFEVESQQYIKCINYTSDSYEDFSLPAS